eukprot:6190288-Pleurochrysis_carterae.AAC.1
MPASAPEQYSCSEKLRNFRAADLAALRGLVLSDSKRLGNCALRALAEGALTIELISRTGRYLSQPEKRKCGTRTQRASGIWKLRLGRKTSRVRIGNITNVMHSEPRLVPSYPARSPCVTTTALAPTSVFRDLHF